MIHDNTGLERAAARFLGAFEQVFGEDWEHTKDCLRGGGPGLIAHGHTFIEPGQSDEYANWCRRGGLLKAYRHLAEVLRLRQVHPEQYNPDELN